MLLIAKACRDLVFNKRAFPEELRARGFAIRDVFPDALRGVITAEEAQDMPAQPPMPRASGPTIDSVATPAAAPEPVLELTMVDCAMVERIAAGGGRWLAWCLSAVEKISTVETLVAWRTAMAPHMEAAISAGGSEAVDELNEAVQAKMDGFAADLETAA